MTDGIEKFEVTDWDIENEFNPDRIKHSLTKKQQIYGIFVGDDSDEEDERPGFGSRSSKDFSAPISFISGGIRVVGKKEEKKEDTGEKGSSSEEEVPVKPSTSTQNRAGTNRTGFSGSRKPNQLAGLRPPRGVSSSEFGSWEKHTKGIGQKLLLQMGYEPGKGLGKSLQGITAPIEASQRKGKGAIGLYGPEHKQAPSVTTVSGADSEDDDKSSTPHQRQWKKKSGVSSKSVKYVYKTMDEVAEESAHKKVRGDPGSHSRVKVIDMTGPEQRVLSGYHQIHQPQHSIPQDQESSISDKKPKKVCHFALPELTSNLNLLVDMTEQEIIRTDRQLRYEQDRVVSLHHEEERLVQVLKQEDKQIKTLDKVLKIVESLDEKSGSIENCLTLEEAASTFKRLQEEHYEEFKLYNLSDLAITIVIPLVKKLLDCWNPLSQKHYCLDVFKDWKDLLETGSQSIMSWSKGPSEDLDPYHQLVWEVWMPPVRKTILEWSARECDPLIELLETWMPLLPVWILDNILEQLVLPRLQTEVDNWNPLTDTLPVHSWLHPWLPLMGTRLEPLYGPIRSKLASALVNWHPSDSSAKSIMEPWKPVFSRGVMDAFIVNNIVPKLAIALQNYIINPHQQHLDVWNWVMAWSDMVPEPCMVSLLEKNFFPRWLQVLYTWLTHSPNYEEVTKWYTGWKSMLSQSLLQNPIIKSQFKRALDIMNQAVSSPQGLLGHQPGAKESMAYLTNVERQQELECHVKPRRDYEAMIQTIRGSSSAASLTMSFKELIEKKAEESNILFMPVAGRFQEGKQVHRFGKTLLYIDRSVIFVFNEKTWVPTSLQSLLDMAG